LVRIVYKAKHRNKTNYIGYIQGEWRTLINYLRYFAFKNK
jgi:hypothetical protein